MAGIASYSKESSRIQQDPSEHQHDRKKPGITAAIVLLSGLIAALYAGTLVALFHNWWTDDAASYGMLVPPIALWIAYGNRNRTFAIPGNLDARGLLVILGACFMFLVGKLGAELFLNRLSLIFLFAGLSWTFWGLPRTRTLTFPLVLLGTMIPLPMLVYNRITLPLQLLSSNAATSIIQFFGRSVYQDGNILHLPHMTLGVAEACSGLNSLASLVVVSLVLGYAECSRRLSRSLLLILAIPFAIAVNVVRVAGTVFLAEVNEEYSAGFYHAFTGWLIFLVGFGFVWLVAKLFHHFEGERLVHEA